MRNYSGSLLPKDHARAPAYAHTRGVSAQTHFPLPGRGQTKLHAWRVAVNRRLRHADAINRRFLVLAMQMRFAALSAISLTVAMGIAGVSAQAVDVIALKSGETAEIGNLFWVVNCRSLLKGPMTVEVLEGPPEVTASIREQKIIPHIQNCAKAVEGGILVLTAKEIKTRTQAKLVVRVKYPTVDGERQKSRDIDLTLLP